MQLWFGSTFLLAVFNNPHWMLLPTLLPGLSMAHAHQHAPIPEG